MDQQDPAEQASDGSDDLYDIATWEERTSVDGLAVALYRLLVASTRVVVILAALFILAGIGGPLALTNPQVDALTLFPALSALAFVGYVCYSDATQNEPLSTPVVMFLLGVPTATFAAIPNPPLSNVSQTIAGESQLALGPLGSVVFYSLVVRPVEETTKFLAIRLYAYSHDSFSAVIDGAVYGAMVDLGFATIENALYITRNSSSSGLDVGSGDVGTIAVGGMITAVRALAGPRHVIYSAIADYYPGLAKLNKENAGPIAIKGLILAVLVHVTYGSMVGLGSIVTAGITGLSGLAAFLVYVIIYDGVFGLYFIGKLRRYSQVYHSVHASGPSAVSLSSE